MDPIIRVFTSSFSPSSWWFSNNLVFGHHVCLIVVNRLSLLSSWSLGNLVIGHHPCFISINFCILVVLFLVFMFISLLKAPCHCHPFNGFAFNYHVYFIIISPHHHHSFNGLLLIYLWSSCLFHCCSFPSPSSSSLWFF